MFREGCIKEWVFTNILPAHRKIEGTPQYLMNVMDGRCRDVFPHGPPHIGSWLCLCFQKMIVVIYRFCFDRTELFVTQVGMYIILQQSVIAVIGRCPPFFQAIFFNELIKKFTDCHIPAVYCSNGICRLLMFNLGFPAFGRGITESGFPDLLTLFSGSLIINNRI